jgi:hypothetical protein
MEEADHLFRVCGECSGDVKQELVGADREWSTLVLPLALIDRRESSEIVYVSGGHLGAFFWERIGWLGASLGVRCIRLTDRQLSGLCAPWPIPADQ